MTFTAISLAGIVVGWLSVLSVALVLKVAIARGLYDQPNERSLHSKPVPRLGGAAFVPVLLAAVGLVWFHAGSLDSMALGFLGTAVGLYVLSVLDDLFSLSSLTRLIIQVMLAVVFMMQGASCGALWWTDQSSAAVAYLLAVLWLVGVTNIYNFMDGIDGIAGIQAVVAGLGWFLLCWGWKCPNAGGMALFSAAVAAGFLRYNWSPARVFMGDAGSAVLGYCFAAMPFLVLGENRDAGRVGDVLLYAVSFLWPFLSDGAFTLMCRICRRENILKAHRSHLYQRLALAGWRHRKIAGLYGALSVVGAAGGLLVQDAKGNVLLWMGAMNSLVFLLLWQMVRRTEAKKVQQLVH